MVKRDDNGVVWPNLEEWVINTLGWSSVIHQRRLRGLKISRCLGFRACLRLPALFFYIALLLGFVTRV